MEIRRAWTPFSGSPQTRETLRLMRNATRRAVYDPEIIQRAVAIVRGVNGRDRRALAGAIEDWTRHHVSYLDDPIVHDGGDFLRVPSLVLREIDHHGVARIDCDDAAMFVAALALCVGLYPRFHAVAFYDQFQPYQHVWTEVLTESGWYPLDVTATGKPLPPIAKDLYLEVV